ncbi:hypothetical protein JYU34_018427 [Plutella xylostella]|uniref:Uncharacterized protein n=1 Tax=Plutella xylostella TaxID=51655 RepID=A0ABQ7PXT5_PLUXY|nr:hypothetical protein JYU34_018427 [Plutella xylostella]
MNTETEQIFILNPSDSQGFIENQKSSETTTVNLENAMFSNICRTCATVTEFIIPIFHGEGLQNNLADKIHKHLPIQVTESDELPQVVCYQCASTLLAWHELVACCVQADAALRTRLAADAALRTTLAVDVQVDSKPGTSTDACEVTPQDNHDKDAESPSKSGCGYCAAALAGAALRRHVEAAHAHQVFLCEHCQQYVDRRRLVQHMSAHAQGHHHAGDVSDTGQLTELQPRSEFSDQSDAEEGGFGPLPESVFEAIEDSQDSLPPAPAPAPAPAPDNTAKKKDKTRTCPICFKVYTASSSYFYHMKYFHKGSKEHECDVCQRKFATRGSLAQHVLTHGDELKFECKTCGKRFRTKASLYIHNLTHTGKKQWSCGECGRSFQWRQLLARHAARHEGGRRHRCAHCGRGFSIKCDLTRHAATHAAGRHACAKCGATFAQPRYLKVHMDKKHTAAPPPATVVADVTQA